MVASNDFPQFTKCTLAEVPLVTQNDVGRVAHMSGVSFDGIYYKYNDSFVVKLVLTLELPTRYDHTQGLVNSQEPVFVKFLSDYPDSVPRAYIGRSNFDFKHTPHVYCDRDGLRPICLFRGNGDEWFANMEIEDYVKHLRSWYEDLASNANIENGGEFEPLRLEGYRSTISYDYEHVSEEIETSSADAKEHKDIFFVYLKGNKLVRITKENKWLLKSIVIENKELVAGAVCWCSSKEPNNDYDVNLPSTFAGLRTYARKYSINIEEATKEIIDWYKGESSRFIIILAIRRSCNLIGVHSVFQLVNFEVALVKNRDEKYELREDSEVCFHVQNSPFTTTKAHEMSNLKADINPSLIVVGCGALGSKVSMHLIRSGITNMLLSDPDKMSAHNLSRHALLASSVNSNKAISLKNEANAIFFHETLKICSLQSAAKSIIEDEQLLQMLSAEYLLDFTASKVVFNQLVKKQDRPQAISAAIYDDGNFGLLLYEGREKRLRLDDLLVTYYSMYKKDTLVSNYLMCEKAKANEPSSIVNVGLGCNSETFILADDAISAYAASMSITIKNIFKGNNADGGCWIYRPGIDGSMQVQRIDVPMFYCYNDDGWCVRISAQVMEAIIDQANCAGIYETGGYLVGQCNQKTKTIHVVDQIKAPNDTIHKGDYLILGKQGVKKNLSHIERRSGSTFGYIGEWHSHPNGPNEFSVTDSNEFVNKLEEMKSNEVTKPILELLITPEGMSCTVLSLI